MKEIIKIDSPALVYAVLPDNQEGALSPSNYHQSLLCDSSCIKPHSSALPADTPVTPSATQPCGMHHVSSHDSILCILTLTCMQDSTQLLVSVDTLNTFHFLMELSGAP